MIYGYLSMLAFVVYLFLFIPRFKKSLDSKDSYSIRLNGLSVLACIVLLVGSIDPMGMAGIVTYHVYYICDEIAAAALLVAAVIMIDSIVKIGRSIEQNKKASLVEGLNPLVLRGTEGFLFGIFIIPMLVSMFDKDKFLFWAGIKGLGGGLHLLFVMILVSKNVAIILEGCKSLPEDKQAALKARFKRCTRSGYSISFLLLASCILDFLEPDSRFKISVGAGGFILWAAFRAVFVLVLSLYYVTNKNKGQEKKKGEGSSSRKKSTVVSKASTVAPES
jgi:hypothetical protein